MFHNQIMHHKPCFNLFILHNKLFDDQGISPSVLIHALPFVNHLKITLKVQSSTQTKIKLFYCTKFVIAPVKGFRLVRKMPECTIEFSK